MLRGPDRPFDLLEHQKIDGKDYYPSPRSGILTPAHALRQLWEKAKSHRKDRLARRSDIRKLRRSKSK